MKNPFRNMRCEVGLIAIMFLNLVVIGLNMAYNRHQISSDSEMLTKVTKVCKHDIETRLKTLKSVKFNLSDEFVISTSHKGIWLAHVNVTGEGMDGTIESREIVCKVANEDGNLNVKTARPFKE